MPILNSLISWVMIKRTNQIEFFKQNPLVVQKGMLFELLNTAQDTLFGKEFKFNEINTIDEFQKRVPIQDYESLKPYVQKIFNGEQNILWPSEIRWFAKSSGTTSDKSKFIPVSKESLENCHFRGGKDAINIYSTLNPETKLLRGKGLIIGGSHQINNLSAKSYYGDLSAVLIQNMPFWSHFIRTPDISIALMDEWEEKIEKMAQATIKENVTSISGVPSWTLVLIKKIFEITGKDNLSDVWPNLELFIHGGVSFEPYKEQFQNIIKSPNMHYLETYNASEGFFAIQDSFSRNDMLLMLDYGIFYEFIPMNEFGSENQKAISIEDIELGINYAIIITTNSGLWRYLIGDTVTFTSKKPYRIKITGRTKHFINAFGEEIIIDNANKALQAAAERTNAIIREYTAAPLYIKSNAQGRHQWLIEFEKMPSSIEHFTEILDNTLKALNSDYEAKRYKSIALEKPEVFIAKNNLFYEWLKLKGKLGGQHKIPRLANNRIYIDDLLKLNNNKK